MCGQGSMIGSSDGDVPPVDEYQLSVENLPSDGHVVHVIVPVIHAVITSL